MPSGWSDLALQCGGMCSASDTMESLKGKCDSPVSYPSVRIKHLTRGPTDGSRFPKLDECAHFHYENVDIGPIKVSLCDERSDGAKVAVIPPPNGTNKQTKGIWFTVFVTSISKTWSVRRSYENFQMLDRQLHHCIYDRKYSQLLELPSEDFFDTNDNKEDYFRVLLTEYLERFSQLAGNLINCGPVLNWLELDNRGNRLIVTDEAAINTPAVAAAYVVKRYTAQANDEISFEVGDMVSVIDMPPPEESTWWRGKKGFEVGFFPCECVEVIGNKVPQTLKAPRAPTKPVLRKHGKLIAFFRSFLLSRPSRRKLKQTGILKERVFGCDLGEHLMNTGRDIPLVLKCCTEFIEEHGILDGIYRLSGVTSNIQKLRIAFDEDKIPDLQDEAILQDIHCMASLLKMYFRELPNPLLTYQLYDKFVAAVQAEDDVRLLKLRDVIQQLPPPHYRTAEYLMKHLSKVAARGNQTGMTPKNVAIVWAPNLLRSRDVEGGGVGALHVVGVQAILTEYLIRYVDLIFSDRIPTFPSPCLENGSPERVRPKSLAISTPTKLLSLEEARSRALSANLLPVQQKYIDVGGGPQSLPEKYHTVIDLPIGKHGNIKPKKSPSGWKSFFSRGWHSSSARGRKEMHSSNRNRKGHKISKLSPQHLQLTLQDKAVTESDVSHITQLRTVKSAESLLSLGGGMSSCNSDILNSLTPHEGNKLLPPYLSSFDETLTTESEGDQASPFKSPSHLKHIRSMSHDSYFESGLGITLEEEEMDTYAGTHISNSENTDLHSLAIEYNKLVDESEDENNPPSIDNITVVIDGTITLYSLENKIKDEEKEETEVSLIETTTCTDEVDNDAVCFGLNDDKKDEVNNIHYLDAVERTECLFQGRGKSEDNLYSGDTKVEDAKVTKRHSLVEISQHPQTISPIVSSNTSQALLKHVRDGVVTYRSPEEIQPYQSPLRISHSSMHYRRDTSDGTNDATGDQYGKGETVIVEVHAAQESSSEEENLEFHAKSEGADIVGKVSSESSDDSKGNTSSRCSGDLSDTQELLLNMSVEATISDTLSLSQLQSFDLPESSIFSESLVQETTDNAQLFAEGSFLSTPLSPTMGNVSDMPSTNEISGADSLDKTDTGSEKNSDNLNIFDDSNVADETLKAEETASLTIETSPVSNLCTDDLVGKIDIETEESSKIDLPPQENQQLSEESKHQIICSNVALISPFDGPETNLAENMFKNDLANQQNSNQLQIENNLINLDSHLDSEVVKCEQSVTEIIEKPKAVDLHIFDNLNDLQLKSIEKELQVDVAQNKKNKLYRSNTSEDKKEVSKQHSEANIINNHIAIESKDCSSTLVQNTFDTQPMYERVAALENQFRSTAGISDVAYSITDNKSPFSLRKNFGLEKLSPVSPVEESRRRFESEIGRTIVRDRRMRLEMEQIQAEGQQKALRKQESLVSPSEPSAHSKIRVKLRHHSSEEIPCIKLSEKSFDNTELRRSPGRHLNTLPSDRKRGSDPQEVISRFKLERSYSEQRRFPESNSVQSRYIVLEKRSSVKELLTKFDPKYAKECNTSHFQQKREFLLENAAFKPKARLSLLPHQKALSNALSFQNSSLNSRCDSFESETGILNSEQQEVYHSLPEFSLQPSFAVQRSSSSTSVPSVLNSKTGIVLTECYPHDYQIPNVSKVVCSKGVLKSPIAVRPQSLNFENCAKTMAQGNVCRYNPSGSNVNTGRDISNNVLRQRDDIFQKKSSNVDKCSPYRDYTSVMSSKEYFRDSITEEDDKCCTKERTNHRRIETDSNLSGASCSDIPMEMDVNCKLDKSHHSNVSHSNFEDIPKRASEKNNCIKTLYHCDSFASGDISRMQKKKLTLTTSCQFDTTGGDSAKRFSESETNILKEVESSDLAENSGTRELYSDNSILSASGGSAIPPRTSKRSSVITSVRESETSVDEKGTFDADNEKMENVPK